MGLTQLLTGVSLLWGILHGGHYLYHRFKPAPPVIFRPAQNFPSLTLSLFRIQYFTTGLNSLFSKLGASYPHFFQLWFMAGAWFGLAAMVTSVLLLSYSIYGTLAMQPDKQVLTPVIPGFNLPNSHLLYYFVALSVSGILHEIGHAMAAVSQGVAVNGFGVFLVFIYPGAYVDLCVEDMVGLSPLRQLRVYCAGVWHNFIICLACAGIIFLLPVLLFPLYSSGENGGLMVVDVVEKSPLSGHLFPGSLVERLDDCRVDSLKAWQDCMSLSFQGKSLLKTGNCVPRQQIAVLPEEIYNCCKGNDTIVASSLCFIRKFVNDPNDIAEACLPVRQTTSNPECETDDDCWRNRDLHLRADERLLRIHVLLEPVVLFLGDPRVAYFTIQVTPYIPRLGIFPLSLPGILEMLMNYTISLSAALALLNMVPAYFLDGQWALLALVDILLPRMAFTRKKVLAEAILMSGSALFISAILLSLYGLAPR